MNCVREAESGELGVASRWRFNDWVARAASTFKASTETGADADADADARAEDEVGGLEAWGEVDGGSGASVVTGPFSDAMSLGNDHEQRN